jgi:hypothetical protein
VKRRRFFSDMDNAAGSVLLEVVLATVLVGILVVPLATSFAGAVEQTRANRMQATAVGPEGQNVDAASGWEWGPRIIGGWWRPGPVLHLKVVGGVAGSAETALMLGLWVDGWPKGEWPVDAGGTSGEVGGLDETLIGPAPWTGLAGGELTIRARTGDGPWGPPWRLAVPGPAGDAPAPGPVLPDSALQPVVVAHRAAAGTESLTASWNADPLSPPAFGAPFVVTARVQGWGAAVLDQGSQWWWMEDGRSVDLYF